MPVVVQKYGGSSVADVEKIRKVAAKIAARRQAGDAPCVVVSAMGDTTDELLALAKAIAQAPPHRELDMLLSAGERISMALLSMALQELGVPAISFTGSQSGIITTEDHANARIVEVRPHRVQEALGQGRVVIVAGYQGVSRAREVTTLGRGGSDTTAVALAAALGADCEIYSDVAGVFTADPRVVPSAQRLPQLSYEEMQELAHAGAKVLNAQAVEFAKAQGITIYARATASALPGADPSADGTVVRKYAPRPPGTVVGVASEKDVLVLTCPSDPRALLACQVIELLDQHRVAGKQLHVADGQLTLVISRENLHEESRVRDALERRFGDAVLIADALGAVSVVGAGINASFENVRRGSQALSAANVEPLHGLATSSFRITWMLDRMRVDDAVRALHQTFIEKS